MKYRVVIDLAFDSELDAVSLFNAAKAKFQRAKSLSKREPKLINIHRCYHDEAVNKPCETIEELKDAQSDRADVLSNS